MKVKVLASGSKGNVTYVEDGNTRLLIDIGMRCIYVEEKLREMDVEPKTIDAILITHTHTDHIMGLFWIFKAMMGIMKNRKYEGQLNIYCNREVARNIEVMMPCLLPIKGIELLKQYMIIHILDDGMHKNIIDLDFEFFDVLDDDFELILFLFYKLFFKICSCTIFNCLM